jgi:hypothetical protein
VSKGQRSSSFSKKCAHSLSGQTEESPFFTNVIASWVLVAHACNPCY